MNFKWPEFNLDFDVRESAILIGLSGSKSYGTDHPLSDTDWKGVLVPPLIYTLSPFKNFEQTTWKSEAKSGRFAEQTGEPERDEEGTIYGLKKFVNLCSSCNPNVIELLFLEKEHYAKMSMEGQILIDNREHFLSQRALFTFSGYAMSQLKRIKTHKSWIDNPPPKITREDLGLPNQKVLDKAQIEAAEKLVSKNLNLFAPWLGERRNEERESFWESVYTIIALILSEKGISYDFDNNTWVDFENEAKEVVASSIGFDSNFMEYLRKEKQYSQNKFKRRQYESWLKNRNPARADLEARYGYDCKHAMHLVRLLRMGEELVKYGEMNVFRPDREELKEIRNGSWAYDDLIKWSDSKVEELNTFVRQGKSVLPKKPDIKKIEQICTDVQESFYSLGN